MTVTGTPVVVTGLGIVAPNGVGTDAYWQALVDGKGAIGPINAFDAGRYPVRLAGEARDFDGADEERRALEAIGVNPETYDLIDAIQAVDEHIADLENERAGLLTVEMLVPLGPGFARVTRPVQARGGEDEAER